MGILKKDYRFWESAITNTACYDFYYDKIKELSISVFEWQNVPDEIDVRFMELMLFERGAVVFFRDEDMQQYLCLPYAEQGKWNVYRIPLLRRAFASNGYNKKLDIDNSVIIYNNVLRIPSIRDCKLFARRLANFDRVIDTNVNAQKTPVLIRCSEKERLTLINLYKQYEGNEPFIFGDQELAAQPLNSVRTDAPYVADRIYDLKTRYWNEMLTFKGISNLNVQKKERLITDEVARSQGGTIASRYSGLMMRQQACEKINKMFGLDIWCEFREDIDGNNMTDSGQDPGEDGDQDE
ncbi:MAG: hypothetical protein J6T08_10500 [Lentisphaeria bacterium]|nr:hypothetical protein [Lentisphaeria bacterium]